MPSTNPRTQVTLSPSLDSLVIELARLQRASKSQVLRELFEAAEPALRRAVALMQAASMASESVRSGLRESLDIAQDRAERSLGLVLSDMDSMGTDLVTVAEMVRARRPARKAQAPTRPATPVVQPPLSNRGVRSRKRVSKQG